MVENMEKPKIEIVEVSEDNRYGKFVCEPLERGYGTTIGNSLRRILLSSLPGAAITSIRIDGVLHEFSTIPGVRDDVTNIVLNLKQLRLKMFTDEPKVIRIDIEGCAHLETLLVKMSVFGDRLSQIAGADNYHAVFFVQPENRADLLIKTVHTVSVSLLPEASKIVQVLPDLRCRVSDQIAEFLGGNLLHAFLLQLDQISPVPREPLDYRV